MLPPRRGAQERPTRNRVDAGLTGAMLVGTGPCRQDHQRNGCQPAIASVVGLGGEDPWTGVLVDAALAVSTAECARTASLDSLTGDHPPYQPAGPASGQLEEVAPAAALVSDGAPRWSRCRSGHHPQAHV